jgi:hypothetical protein
MKTSIALASLIALVSTCSLAQEASETASPASTSKPVAYVYVSRPTHVDGFAASSAGKLTSVPGSPFANTSVTALSVTKKFLLGETNKGQSSATSFSIASNGSLKKVQTVNLFPHLPSGANACADYPDTQVDGPGESLYLQENPNCETNGAYLVYHISSNGDLTYMGNSGGGIDGATQGSTARLHMAGSDKFAFDSFCAEDEGNTPTIDIYSRASNGMLEYKTQYTKTPFAKAGVSYCYGTLAADSSNHLAVAVQQIDSQDGDDGWITGPYYLASFSIDSEGNLSTTNTYKNMPLVAIANNIQINAMSIGPGNKYLAVAGDKGFQVFHFNGSDPITAFSGALQSGVVFQGFGWDKAGHLYALGGGNLYVYNVTSSGVKEASGSPYSIPESGAVSVLDLQ